ncbi:MAG: ATP-binding protein [Mediterranea sp.]|jgi:predicted AAA+ superfamily ATPase|nr:ATP-binding protein [Mediterranea sp.]
MPNSFINRTISGEILASSREYRVITITGPRQSGKTTLCKKLFPSLPYVNLEDISTLREVEKDAKRFIANYPDGAVIDEAHNFPDIFSYLQVEVDKDIFENTKKRMFVVTGSSNFALLERITQSMAGRTAVLTLLPLSIHELSPGQRALPASTLTLNGGYPSVWNESVSRGRFFRDYYTTYIERDARKIVNIKDLRAFQTFMTLCAGRVGTEFNASALSNEVGVTSITINSWLNILAASYIIYLLPPYHENIGKRLVKTPKIYFYDTGLAAYLLGIENEEQFNTHPLRGALFENMVINEMIKEQANVGKKNQLYFYRDKSGREIDAIYTKAQYLQAFEIKSAMTYNKNFFKHLAYLEKLFPGRVSRSAVIYDGTAATPETMEGLYNFRDFRLFG